MVSRSVCAYIFPSIVSIFASALTDTFFGEQPRCRLSEDHALFFYNPHLSHVSDISHSVLPSHFHSILTAAFVPEVREERSRTFPSAILTALRNLVWDLAMQVVS